jgi:apolipoprotein N-acyltransferase
MVHFLTTLSWMTTVTPEGMVGVSAIMAAYLAIWTVFWSRIAGGPEGLFSTLPNIQRCFLGACAWVALEWLRGWLFTGFPWNFLGVSQAPMVVLCQIADLGGVYMVSWLIVFAALTFTVTLRRVELEIRAKMKAKAHLDFSLAMFLIGVSFLYGSRVMLAPPVQGERLHYLCIQPDLLQSLENPTTTLEAMSRMEILMAEALRERKPEDMPDLVIWPETPIASSYAEDPLFHETVQRLTQGQPFALFLGSNDYSGTDVYNAALLLEPKTDEVQIYYKNHLVIFGEYVPLTKDYPWLQQYSPLGSNYSAGSLPGIFHLAKPELTFAALICFEDTVSRVARRSLQFRPDFFVNITNDGWFLRTAQSEQHLYNAMFRAIEFRRPLFRTSNNGVTAVITERGILSNMLGSFAQKDYFNAGYLEGDIVIPSAQVTVYERFGEWVPFLGGIFSIVALFRMRKKLA